MTQAMNLGKPAPEPTAVSAPFWEGAVQGKFVIQQCEACGAKQHYPRPFCTSCLAEDLRWVETSGRARLYSFTVVRRAASKAFETSVPYVLGIVELDEGPHVTGNVVGCEPEAVHVGMPLKLVFEHREGRTGAIPQWQPVEE